MDGRGRDEHEHDRERDPGPGWGWDEDEAGGYDEEGEGRGAARRRAAAPRRAGRVEFSKRSQISAPSDPQIISLLKKQVEDLDARYEFNGGKITQQVYLNAIVIALEIRGRKFRDYLYREGVAVLAPAYIADEPHAPPGASRPLRRQIEEAAARLRAAAPPARPLPGTEIPHPPQGDSPADRRGGLQGEDRPVARKGDRPGRK